MKWVKVDDKYRIDMEKVRCYGIPYDEPDSIEFDYDDGNDRFAYDSKEEARDILKKIDIAVGLYSIKED